MIMEVKAKLSQHVDDYIDYWRALLEQVELICPMVDQPAHSQQVLPGRSNELQRLIKDLKALIGTHSVDENISDFVRGDGASDFDPVLKNLTRRLLPDSNDTRTPEKAFISRCYDTDDKESAGTFIRFLTMLEFESSTLHYALIMKDWLQDEDIRLSAYFASQDSMQQALSAMCDDFAALTTRRQHTEQLFYCHWQYVRNNTLRTRAEEMSQGLRAVQQSIDSAFVSEQHEDEAVKQTKALLFEQMQVLQESANHVLKDAEKIHVTPSKVPEANHSFMSWFSPSASSHGVSSSTIARFQRGDQYKDVVSFLSDAMHKVFASYTKLLDLMQHFDDRERTREASKQQVLYWHQCTDLLIEKLLDVQRMKNQLPDLFYFSCKPELLLSSIASNALCAKLEQFMIDYASAMSDGAWPFQGEEGRKRPEDCLNREHIARFRKYMMDYKMSSKGSRLFFNRLYKLLHFLAWTAVLFFCAKGVLSLLPASWLAYTYVAKLAAWMVIPPAAVLVFLAAALVLIAMSWRQANHIKTTFARSLDDYFAHQQSNRDHASGQSATKTYYARFSDYIHGVAQTIKSCFTCPVSTQVTTDNQHVPSSVPLDEFDQFIGSRPPDAASQPFTMTMHNQYVARLPDPHPNQGRYGRGHGFFASHSDEFVTIDLNEHPNQHFSGTSHR